MPYSNGHVENRTAGPTRRNRTSGARPGPATGAYACVGKVDWNPTKPLVRASTLCSRLGGCPTQGVLTLVSPEKLDTDRHTDSTPDRGDGRRLGHPGDACTMILAPSNLRYRGTTVTEQRNPGARPSLTSAVSRAQSSDSANATYEAS